MSIDEDDDDEDDGVELEAAGDDGPWQAPYAWAIVTSQSEVPSRVHAAAVEWWVEAFAPTPPNPG